MGNETFHYWDGLTVDCSQSPIFSWDRLDIPRLLTVTAILILKCTEGAGVGDYAPAPYVVLTLMQDG